MQRLCSQRLCSQRLYPQVRRAPREEGYNLVVLTIAVTVLNVLVAAALPMWSQIIRREKEAELIFRGMQYAEAIRVCQRDGRLGGLPTNLAQLEEHGCIRKLWKNPLTEDGSWKLLIQRQQNQNQGRGQGQGNNVSGNAGNGGNPRNQSVNDDARGGGGDGGRDGDGDGSVRGDNDGRRGGRDGGRDGGSRQSRRQGQRGQDPIFRFDDERSKNRVYGPIRGVASPDGGDAVRTFMGSDQISEWEFTAEFASATLPVMVEGAPQNWPIHADTFWRPWPPGITPPQLGLPQQGNQGGNVGGGGGGGLKPAPGSGHIGGSGGGDQKGGGQQRGVQQQGGQQRGGTQKGGQGSGQGRKGGP